MNNKINYKRIIKLISVSVLSVYLLFFGLVSNVYAASASVSISGGGTVNTSQNISVNVSVSASEAFNAVTVNVNFSNLTYVGVSSNSAWTGVSGPTRSGNSITFSGARLGGSFTSSTNVLSINFKAPASVGSSSITATGTVALADGSGTQVGTGSKTVSYKVVTPPPPAPTVPGNVEVSSTTHPDSNTWYLAKIITLNWKAIDGVTGYSYIFDQTENTTPDDVSEGTDLTKTMNDLPDGVSYFHIKAQNSVGWSTPTHFKIQVDTINPDPFTITKVQDETTGNNVIYFATNDSLSGIQKYTVNVDGNDLGEQVAKYTLPAGSKSVTVTAYDKAGNTTTSTLSLITSSLNSLTNISNQNINMIVVSPLALGIVTAIVILLFGIFLIVKMIKKSKKENQLDKGNDKKISSK